MGTITVSNLGKAFRVYNSHWSRLAEWLSPFARQDAGKKKWVLRDINFSVDRGEAVGVIGLNGSGKSTLLKVITGITNPSTGNVNVSGRVAALLELGIGFHPDFTGRQNVFMAGQLLGHSTDALEQLLPDIIAFAEIGDYIDQPLRTFSSGMNVRLAFSVATAVQPDLLIVDEALSVGDAYFQHKCFARIRDYQKKGMTLLMVTHDNNAVTAICDRVILLNAGRMLMIDRPEVVLNYYNELLGSMESTNDYHAPRNREYPKRNIFGSGQAVITDVRIVDQLGLDVDTLSLGEKYCLSVTVVTEVQIDSLVLGYTIKDKFGQVIFGTNSFYTKNMLENIPAKTEINFNHDLSMSLGSGTYSVSLALVDGRDHLKKTYQWVDHAHYFTVVNISKDNFLGMVWLENTTRVKIK